MRKLRRIPGGVSALQDAGVRLVRAASSAASRRPEHAVLMPTGDTAIPARSRNHVGVIAHVNLSHLPNWSAMPVFAVCQFLGNVRVTPGRVSAAEPAFRALGTARCITDALAHRPAARAAPGPSYAVPHRVLR